MELIGDPYACAEAPINVVGVSLDADGAWIASTVTHSWDYGEGGGAVTTVEAGFGMHKDNEKKSKPRKRKAKASPKQPGDYISILDR